MMKLLIIAALVAFASSVSTVTATYPHGAGSFISTPGFTFTFPFYPLDVTTGDNIQIVIRLVDPAPGITLDDVGMGLFDSSYSSVQTIPAFTGGLTQTTLVLAITSTAAFIMVFGCVNSLNVFQLDVRVNGVSKLKIADMLRVVPAHYIYLKNATTLDVSVSGIDPGSSGDPVSVNVQEYFGTNIFKQLLAPSTSTVGATGTYSVQTPEVQAGYSVIVYSFPALTPTVSYESDPYPCPFASTYLDYYGTFKGCVRGNAHQEYVIQAHSCGIRQYFDGSCKDVDPLCNTFDPLTGACYTCWQNSRPAVRGSCSNATSTAQNITCHSGTHAFQNRVCIPDECASIFANGTCNACINAAFSLNNGVCIAISCGPGQYYSASLRTCNPLPERCVAFNPILQICKECINGYVSLPINGQCFSLCPAGRFFVNNNCYLLPQHCLSLTNVLHCSACETGYRLIQGECRSCSGPNPNFPCVTCPLDHFVNPNGQCVRISQNCDRIDQTTGLCLSCASGVSPVNGICCQAGQTVQNGVCTSQSNSGQGSQVDFTTYYRYCKIYSPPVSSCLECLSGRSFVPDSDRCQ